MQFAFSQIFICAPWARFDPLAFCTEICAPLMGADSGYEEELATYWVMVKGFQQKRFDLGELLGDRVRAGQNSWKPTDQKGFLRRLTSVNPVAVGAEKRRPLHFLEGS